VDTFEGREIVGEKGTRDCAGVIFPYYRPGDVQPHAIRLRRDHPDRVAGKNGKPKLGRKYLDAPGARNRLYIPPGVTWQQLADIRIPVVMTEGEKKCLALWRLANHGVSTPRFIPVGITGVWNWRGRVGTTINEKGERVPVKGPIPDLGWIAWNQRTAYILFDVNLHTDGSVKHAKNGLARHLASCKAKPAVIELPPDCGVNGVDDLLADWGPDRVLRLFDQPKNAIRPDIVLPPQFHSRPQGLFRSILKGEDLRETQLTNYTASINTSIVLDDGVETQREFEIQAEVFGRRFRFTIPASEFAAMEWPIKLMGPAAITYPNQKDYARTAIQWFSIGAEERRIYTHTGWREIDGHFLYIHAGGAIGAEGLISGIQVRLAGSLGRYQLSLTQDREGLVKAIGASLRLVDLGSPTVSFPLRAATFRAIFGGCDFALHLAGETGTFKSERAALEQQHFGAEMTRLNLPASWSSTANALEATAFQAKDTLLVVDDFAPQGSSTDVARYHAAGERLFRAVGNHAGRGRLDSSARLREAKPPRSLVLSTGEDIPRGHSVRARLLVLEMERGSISTELLTECQKDGVTGLYAQATAAFIRWIAMDLEAIQKDLGRRVADLRLKAGRDLAHCRTPDVIANLQAGFDIYLRFAEESKAIDAAKRTELSDRCWNALVSAARAQARYQAASEPSTRFVELLRSALASGHCHVASRDGTVPDCPLSAGWRQEDSSWLQQPKLVPRGDRIGWLDGDDLYLEPTAAFGVAQAMSREAGEAIPIAERTLRKRLHERGLLLSTDAKRETLTVRRMLCGSLKNVLHFRKDSLLSAEPDIPDIPSAGQSETPAGDRNVGSECQNSERPDNDYDRATARQSNNLGLACRDCRVRETGTPSEEKQLAFHQNQPSATSGNNGNPTVAPDMSSDDEVFVI
jgi:hypothetical protein